MVEVVPLARVKLATARISLPRIFAASGAMVASEIDPVPVEIEYQRIGARIAAGEACAQGELDVVAELRNRRLCPLFGQ